MPSQSVGWSKNAKGPSARKNALGGFTILHSLTRGYTNVVVLGDGEFDNGEVVTACNGWGWRFVFRTAKNTKIYDGEEEYPIGRLGPQVMKSSLLSMMWPMPKTATPVNATVWTERNWDGPLYLLSKF
ncbi:MAG: hypothetical protein R2825_06235 [Saprospiraceae bacterium]